MKILNLYFNNYNNCETFTYWYYIVVYNFTIILNLLISIGKIFDKSYINKKLNEEQKDEVFIGFLDYF